MLLYTKLAPPRAPKRRSRAGCTYCKEKKKKCDEKRPQCSRCVERSVECAYEAIKPRQRRKRDSQSSIRTGTFLECVSPSDVYSEWQEDASTPTTWEYASPLEARTSVSPLSYILTDTSDVPTPYETEVYDIGADGSSQAQHHGQHHGQHHSHHHSHHQSHHQSHNQSQQVIQRDSYAVTTTVAPSSSARSLPPDLAMIAPCPVGSPTLEFRIPAFSEFSARPNRRALVDHFCNVLSHLIVFREDSGNPFQQLVLPLSHNSPPVMNAIYALASAHLEYRGVQNPEKSLYFHDQAIQGLAGVIKSQAGVNRNELLAAIMLLVYYEVLVQRGRTNIIDGHLKGAFAIMCLNRDRSPVGSFLERAFGFYDVIAALSLGTPPISTAPSAGGLLPVPPPDAPPASPLANVDTLLGMATTLWPVMHRLSNLLFTKKELESAQRLHQTSKAAVLRTEFEATSRAIEAALTRWKPRLPPNIIMRDDDDDNDNDDDVLVLNGLEQEKLAEMARLQSILHNALAYRHSAFVYLYRTIYRYGPGHELVQRHCHTSLRHCVATTAARGPMSALLWPLFAAACEAISAEDRELAKRAFGEIEQRQGMTNIEEAWGIIQEVWKRLDEGLHDDDNDNDNDIDNDNDNDNSEEEDKDENDHGNPHPNLWRDICAERGVTIVFG